MARLDLAKARQLGYNDQQIQQYAQQKGVQLYDSSQQQAQPVPEHKRSLIASLLPVGGSIVGGIGGSLLGGPVGGIGGATAGGGIGELIAQALSGEKSNYGEAAKQAGMGTLGEVTGLGIGRLLARPASSLLKGGEEALAGSVIKPKVPSSLGGAGTESRIVNTVRSEVGSGSAKKLYRDLQPSYDKLQTQIESTLSKKSSTSKVADIVRTLDNNISDNINFDESIPAYRKAKDKFINQLLSKSNKSGENGLTINDNEVYQFKRNLSKQLSGAFKKARAGTPLTPQEEVGLSVWKSIDNLLPNSVNKLSRKESDLIMAAPGLKASRDTPVEIPILGNIPGARQPLQVLQSKGADILGALQSPLLAGGASRSAGQAVARNLFSSGGDTPTNNTQPLPDQSQAPATNSGENYSGTSSDGNGPLSALSNPDTLKQLAILDLLRGGKNIDKIIALSKFVTPAADASSVKKQNLSNSVDLLLQNFQTAGGGQGPAGGLESFLGRTPGVRSLGLDKQAQIFEDQRKALIAPLARAISGEVGVLTDKDISRAEGLLPRLSDPADVAAIKIKNLKQLIEQSGSAGTADSGILNTGNLLQ
jgi:hypothetical protein